MRRAEEFPAKIYGGQSGGWGKWGGLIYTGILGMSLARRIRIIAKLNIYTALSAAPSAQNRLNFFLPVHAQANGKIQGFTNFTG